MKEIGESAAKLNRFWSVVWGSGSRDAPTLPDILVLALVFVLFFALVGAVTGLILGAINASPGTGAIVGIVVGLLMLGLEYMMEQCGTVLVNIFFWFFTGRFIGAGIATRVQQPVQR